MFCLNCGNQLPEHAHFCSKCGQSVKATALSPESSSPNNSPQPTAAPTPPSIPTTEPTEKDHFKKRNMKNRFKKVIILVFVFAILLATIILLFPMQNRTIMEDFSSALKAGDVSEAITIYDKEIDGTDLALSAPDTVTETLNEALAQFKAGEIEYVDMLRVAQSIEQFCDSRTVIYFEDIDELYTWIDMLASSRVAFTTGQSYQNEKKYAEAIAQYLAVSADDTLCYEDAQECILACQTAYKESILQDAEDLIASEQYSDAVHLLDSALEILPQDPDLSALRDTAYSHTSEDAITTALSKAEEQANEGDYASAIKTVSSSLVIHNDDRLKTALSTYQIHHALTTADSCVKSGDYPGAIAAIEEGLERNPDDNELLQVHTDYCETFLSNVISEADSFAEKLDYASAISIVRSALEVLPNDEALTKKFETLNASKPVSLSTLEAFNGGWIWNNTAPIDSFGNDYSSACNYVVFSASDYYETIASLEGATSGSNGYKRIFSEYHTARQYNALTMQLAPCSSICPDGTAYVQVYADSELVFTSPSINKKTSACEYEVNISDAEYIEIHVNVSMGEVIDGSDEGAIILSDVQLWP